MREFNVRLQPNQQRLANLFFKDGPDVPTFLGFGGPRGGAKSFSVRAIALSILDKYPGSRTFIIRKNWTDLYENHYLKFAQDFPQMTQWWNGSHKEYTLPNRSTLAYKFGDTDREIEQLARGPEAMFHLVDQAEQFTTRQLQLIHTSNRWTNVPMGRCKTGHFFNPGGPGNEYLKRIYYDRQYHAEETPEHYEFIFSKGWENWEWFRTTGLYENAKAFYADSDENRFRNFIKHTNYGKSLWEKPESLRLGELYGSFEHFAGQYYGGVWDENVHVLRPGHAERIIQPWWRRWMAVDWGFAHNAAAGWFAAGKLSPRQAGESLGIEVERDIEVIVLYREHVTSEKQEADFAAELAELTPAPERKQIARMFWSTEAFGVRGSASIVTPVLRSFGLPAPEPAANQRVTRGVGTENERIGGWRLIYNMLRQAANLSGKEVPTGTYEAGPMFVVAGECQKTAEAVPALMRDPDNPEDVLKLDSVSDDVGDMVRYGMTEYLRAKSQAPVEVRRQELAVSLQSGDPTERALRLGEFDRQSRSRAERGRGWR